jgi:CBS domain containing-hemolysin-like protein
MNSTVFSLLPGLVGALALLLLNAALVTFQWAFLKVHLNGSSWTNRNADEPSTHRLQKALLERPDRVLQTLRLANLCCLTGVALLLWDGGWKLHENWVSERPGALSAPVFAVFLYLFLIGLLYPLAESLPTTLGLRYAEGSLRHLAWLVRLVEWLTAPLRRPLQAVIGFGTKRLFPEEPTNGPPSSVETVSSEATPIAGLQPDGSSLGEVAGKILRNAMTLQELVVSDILLPRNQVQYMDLNKSVEENLVLARKTGHTRFPLCEGDLDRCIGLVHIKDIFRRGDPSRLLDLRLIKREILHIGSEDPLEEALSKLLGNKMHMALVVDEFRGTEGVLTLERILEVLVGDIQDEFDTEEANIRLDPTGEYHVLGLTPLHEVDAAFNIRTENDEVSTFSGLITSELERIPIKGEHIELHGLSIRITEVDERRILHARVRVLPPEEISESGN